MGNSTDFHVFDKEIPAELVEPLIEHLCIQIANTSYSLFGDEVLTLALTEILTKHDF